MQITITIPDDNLAENRDALFTLHPNNETDEEGEAKYTDVQWFKELLRRYVVREIRRGKEVIAQATAKAEVTDPEGITAE